MAKNKQTILVMDLPVTAETFIPKARLFILNVTQNPTIFASLIPIASVVTTTINSLDAANTAMKNRTGSSGPRDLLYTEGLGYINNWGSMVQIMVRGITSLQEQINLIQAFGGRVKINGKFLKPPFAGKSTSVGIVTITKKKVGAATNEYQVSYDLGVTWVALVSTHLCKMTVGGQTKGSTVYFRTRANVGLTAGLWITIEVEVTM